MGLTMARRRMMDPPMTPIKSGVTLEASVEDAWSGNEDDDEFILGGADCWGKARGSTRENDIFSNGPNDFFECSNLLK